MAKRRYRPGLPGGRAKYQTADAYASQSREYESRIDQAPGYVSAVLQNDLVVASGATSTVIWQTSTLSDFVRPAVELSGWSYDAPTGKFTCRRPGKYQISLWGIVNNIGNLGEFQSANTLGVGGWVSGTTQNITSVSLTAGDWDVWGVTRWTGTLTGSGLTTSITTTSGVLAGAQTRWDAPTLPTAAWGLNAITPVTRVSISATTTVYLAGVVNFSAGTPAADGYILARRAGSEQVFLNLNVVRGSKSWKIRTFSTSNLTSITQTTDFNFQRGDVLYVEFGNATGATSRNLVSYMAAGTGAEQQFTNLKLWQIG